MPSTPNLIIQGIITVTLTLGILYMRKRKIVSHGYMTLTAVILNASSVLIVMLPSALRIMSGISMNFFAIMLGAHSILGAAAVIAGIYLMAVWRIRKPGESCFMVVNYMKPLAFAWMVSAAVGAYIYYMLL